MYSVDRFENYEFSIAVDSNLLSIGSLVVPSGSLLKEGATTANLEIRAVPDSRVRQAQNPIRKSRSAEQGKYKTFAQTVLSPMFECVSGEGVLDPFPVPLIYSAYIDEFAIKQDGEFMFGFNYDDVCFARLYEITQEVNPGYFFKYSTWRGLVEDNDRATYPVRPVDSTAPAGVVSFALDSCLAGNETLGVDGAVYAFVYAPMDQQVSSPFFDWVEENLALFVLICIGVSFFVLTVVYGCGRLWRYRRKYHESREKVEVLREDVKQMEMYGARAGILSNDIDIVMQDNPMVMQLKDMAEEVSLEELEEKERQAELRRARQEQRELELEVLRNEHHVTSEELRLLQEQLVNANNQHTQPRKMQDARSAGMDTALMDMAEIGGRNISDSSEDEGYGFDDD
jgi:hypothetical protein